MTPRQNIILASASPTRKRLLEQIKIKFTVEASNYEEDHSLDLNPEDLVRTFSQGKARDVAARHENAIVIGADTVGIQNGKVIGKPTDAADAARMLKRLSGRTHLFLTGLTVINTATGQEISVVAKTAVRMRTLSDVEIKSYIATGEPFGKASAFAMREVGGTFIEKIVGEPYTPAGLPLAKLSQILTELGTPVLSSVEPAQA